MRFYLRHKCLFSSQGLDRRGLVFSELSWAPDIKGGVLQAAEQSEEMVYQEDHLAKGVGEEAGGEEII